MIPLIQCRFQQVSGSARNWACLERAHTPVFPYAALDRLVVLVMSVEFAATLGLAEMDPVGGVVAGSLEARRFVQGFQRHWT